MNDIRKISVGKDYPDGVIHYQVGKTVKLNDKPYIVTDILIDKRDSGIFGYNIYIANEEGKVLWKTVRDVPVIIEYNINFE